MDRPSQAAMATSISPVVNTNTSLLNKFRPAPLPRRRRITSDSSVSAQPRPLPPRTARTPPSDNPKTHTVSQAAKPEPITSHKFVTNEMILSDFARRFQNDLPQQVMVTHGVYSEDDQYINISNSERLNVHFIRHRESVKIRDVGSGVEYSLPITSTLEFGPVYNPSKGDINDAVRGFMYRTVADLLKVTENAPLPKFITALTSSSITTPGDRVTHGELIIVKEVRSSKKMGYRQLRVFSMATKTDKFLHETCAGNFTTKAEANKLSIFSIIKYVPNALPLSVMIFPGPNLDLSDQHYPLQPHLFYKVIQLCRTFTDVLLVASSVPEDSVCDGREPFEIPQEIDLELKVVELRESNYEQLRDKSHQIMTAIQGECLKQYTNTKRDKASYVMQEMFLRAVSTAEQDETSTADTTEESGEGDRDYPNVRPLQDGLLSRLNKLEDLVWKLRKAHAAVSPCPSPATTSNSKVEKIRRAHSTTRIGDETPYKLHEQTHGQHTSVETMTGQVTELKTLVECQQQKFHEQLQGLQTELVALRAEAEEGRKQLRELQKNPVHTQQATSLYLQELLASPETAKRNRDLVATLTAEQVLQLMKGVGVGDVQKITLEKVTGDILVELNEDELESELGITKRIAQLKLMKVINGSKPVTDYIQEQEFKSMDIVC